ncbi:MAG: hypothetical protein JW910_00745 [Anaerolineae bacterium]|nr:hypothetical protein [Anaerolineae bacterium]
MSPSLDLLTPWLAFAAILLPLLYLEQWIHQHLFGVGWLLTRDNQRATLFYYIILLPGVFLHEFTQWLAAGALRVKTKKITVWPKPQKNGTLRLDFVQLRKMDGLRAAVIGIIPLLSGIGIVLYISQSIFGGAELSTALATGDLVAVQSALGQLFATPDFWLWLYLLFAIGNAMIPTPADRQGWPIVLGIVGVVAVFLLVIGLGDELVVPVLAGPIADALNMLVAAFGAVLVLDCGVVIVLSLLERALERARGEKVKYRRKPKATPKPKPGGEVPLPDDMAPPHISERKLPIPPAPRQTRRPPPALPTPTPVAQPTSSLPSGRPSYTDRWRPSITAPAVDEAEAYEAEEETPPTAIYTPGLSRLSPVEPELVEEEADTADEDYIYEPLDETSTGEEEPGEPEIEAGDEYEDDEEDTDDDELVYVPFDDV